MHTFTPNLSQTGYTKLFYCTKDVKRPRYLLETGFIRISHTSSNCMAIFVNCTKTIQISFYTCIYIEHTRMVALTASLQDTQNKQYQNLQQCFIEIVIDIICIYTIIYTDLEELD